MKLCTLLLLGDSLIAGLKGVPQSYNAGIVGDTPKGIEHRFDTELSQCPKGKIFIHIGLNWVDVSSSSHVKYLSKIIERTDNQIYIHELFATIKPDKVDNLNQALRKLAFEHKHVMFLEAPKLKPYLYKDGVHLNHKGYKVWKEWIDANLSTTSIR